MCFVAAQVPETSCCILYITVCFLETFIVNYDCSFLVKLCLTIQQHITSFKINKHIYLEQILSFVISVYPYFDLENIKLKTMNLNEDIFMFSFVTKTGLQLLIISKYNMHYSFMSVILFTKIYKQINKIDLKYI